MKCNLISTPILSYPLLASKFVLDSRIIMKNPDYSYCKLSRDSFSCCWISLPHTKRCNANLVVLMFWPWTSSKLVHSGFLVFFYIKISKNLVQFCCDFHNQLRQWGEPQFDPSILWRDHASGIFWWKVLSKPRSSRRYKSSPVYHQYACWTKSEEARIATTSSV